MNMDLSGLDHPWIQIAITMPFSDLPSQRRALEPTSSRVIHGSEANNRSLHYTAKNIVYYLLEDPNSPARKKINIALILTVICSVIVLILSVDTQLTPERQILYTQLETIFSTIFLIEYLLRWWIATDFSLDFQQTHERTKRRVRDYEHKKIRVFWIALKYAVGHKWQWMKQPLAIIDLLAVMPVFYPFRFLRLLYVVRIMKLFRYSRELSLLGDVVRRQSHELHALFSIAVVLWGMVAIAFYVVEHGANPKVSNLWDAVYWMVVTVVTLGYGDITPNTPMGQGVTMFAVFAGLTVTTFASSILIAGLTERIIFLREHRMENRIAQLSDYFIVCGLSNVGRTICRALQDENKPFFGIDIKKERVDYAVSQGWLAIQGDVREEETWKRLNLVLTRAVIISTPDELVNISVILSVRERNPDCLIVASGSSSSSEKRLKRLGADRFVSPAQIGGIQMTHMALRPAAVHLLNMAMKSDYSELEMEEVVIPPLSIYENLPLRDTNLRNDFNVIVVGILPRKDKMIFNPKAEIVIHPGDTLVCMGHKDDLERLRMAVREEKLS
ncbi:MAG: hypothetical protein G8345_05985 [Magnetococcales bacterium]|nr:NAD-binding protein [Magnetococcales bacterium]NGZ26419.1 hypothetical protein [Magnetococcales bacterium]